MESDIGSQDEYNYLQCLIQKHCNISHVNLRVSRGRSQEI